MILGRAIDRIGKVIGQIIGLHLAELIRDAEQNVLQFLGLEHPQNDMPGPHLIGVILERAVNPGPLHRVFQMRGQVGNGRGPARQSIQRAGHIAGDIRRLQLVMLRDAVNVAIGPLQDLMHPMNDLDIGVAAQLAENRSAFNCLVAQLVQFAK